MTNYEKIISMPPRELAQVIRCPYEEETEGCHYISCVGCCETWLNEEAEEEI